MLDLRQRVPQRDVALDCQRIGHLGDDLDLGVLGGVVLPVATAAALLAPRPSRALPVATASLALSTVVVAELIERWQFFRAVAAPRMPGGIA